MRKRVALLLKKAFRANGVVFFVADKDFKKILSTPASLPPTQTFATSNAGCSTTAITIRFKRRSMEEGCLQGSNDILPYHKWVNLKIYNEFDLPLEHTLQTLHLSINEKKRPSGSSADCLRREYQDFSKKRNSESGILGSPFDDGSGKHRRLAVKGPRIDFTRRKRGRPPADFGIIVLDYEALGRCTGIQRPESSVIPCKGETVVKGKLLHRKVSLLASEPSPKALGSMLTISQGHYPVNGGSSSLHLRLPRGSVLTRMNL